MCSTRCDFAEDDLDVTLQRMIRAGPGGPQDPSSEAQAASQAVLGNVIIFSLMVAAIRAAPLALQALGLEAGG